MADLRFNINVQVRNGWQMAELQERLKDLTPAFHQMVQEWTALNADKFEKAKGMEMTGVVIDEVGWAPLTPGYLKSKHPGGAPKRKVTRKASVEYPDWLMVRTGELMRSLEDPELIFQDIQPQDVTFGTPLDADNAMKVRGNWDRRQVIFFSTDDKNMIQRIVGDYLRFGAGFQQRRFTQGLAAVESRREAQGMDAAFEGDPGSGEW